MKYNIGDVVNIRGTATRSGKIGIVASDGYYDGKKNGYYLIICGMPNQTFYYYEDEIEKL